jgi:two-component system phosphate regulon sensor histidine kinase PhoR
LAVPAEVVVIVAVVAFLLGIALATIYARRRPGDVLEQSVTRGSVAHAAAQSADVARLDAGLIDQLEIGVLRLDADLEVIRFNSAAARLLRLEQRRPARRSLMETFVDHRVEDAARAAAVQGSATVELTLLEPDERRVAIRMRRAEDGGLWLLMDDVTELRRLQRIRSEFIDNLSHELRTPLTTIRLLSETLRQDLERADVPPRVRERTGKIEVEIGHLVQMVNELLDLSRIEGGAAELHFQSVDLAAVVHGAIERLRTFAERQGVQLTTELPSDGERRVWGDDERLGQVLINLLHNAVKFSPSGTTVTVAAREHDGQLAIEVRDQGVGIPRADIDRVFERFYKVDKARQRGQGGTGLGLSIARHIIEGHGGRIWAESEEGRGSVFTFTVPLAR